jgi:hypothetical protein
MELAILTYQFDKEEHPFSIKCHANSKQQKPYRRTQDSTLKAIATKVGVEKPRNVFQKERHGANIQQQKEV